MYGDSNVFGDPVIHRTSLCNTEIRGHVKLSRVEADDCFLEGDLDMSNLDIENVSINWIHWWRDVP